LVAPAAAENSNSANQIASTKLEVSCQVANTLGHSATKSKLSARRSIQIPTRIEKEKRSNTIQSENSSARAKDATTAAAEQINTTPD